MTILSGISTDISVAAEIRRQYEKNPKEKFFFNFRRSAEIEIYLDKYTEIKNPSPQVCQNQKSISANMPKSKIHLGWFVEIEIHLGEPNEQY